MDNFFEFSERKLIRNVLQRPRGLCEQGLKGDLLQEQESTLSNQEGLRVPQPARNVEYVLVVGNCNTTSPNAKDISPCNHLQVHILVCGSNRVLQHPRSQQSCGSGDIARG